MRLKAIQGGLHSLSLPIAYLCIYCPLQNVPSIQVNEELRAP